MLPLSPQHDSGEITFLTPESSFSLAPVNQPPNQATFSVGAGEATQQEPVQ